MDSDLGTGTTWKSLRKKKSKQTNEDPQKIHPWKRAWHWKMSIFTKKYIFKWWVFHCHVSFRVGTLMRNISSTKKCWKTDPRLVKIKSLRAVSRFLCISIISNKCQQKIGLVAGGNDLWRRICLSEDLRVEMSNRKRADLVIWSLDRHVTLEMLLMLQKSQRTWDV